MGIPPKIKALMFDLDGTLIRLPQLNKFFDDLLVGTLEEYRVPIPSRENRLALWHSGGEFERVIRSWGVEDYNAFLHTFDVRDLEKRKILAEKGEIFAFPDVGVLEDVQKHARIGLVTNTPPEIALFELEYFNLKQYFDDLVMLGTEEQHIAKPEPDGLIRCLKNLGVAKSRAVMVGDSRSDILGGQNAGVATILVRRPDQMLPSDLEPPPDLIIEELYELLQLIG